MWLIDLFKNYTHIPKRANQLELLDMGSGLAKEVHESLRHIAIVNKWWGGGPLLRRFIVPRVEQLRPRTKVRILDVGTGSGAMPLTIIRWARKNRFTIRIVAVDINRGHLKLARQTTGPYPEIQLVAADANHLPFRAESFDIVLSTLFLHHFNEQELVEMIPSFQAVSRYAVILDDLIRSQLTRILFRIVSSVFTQNTLTRQDGELSILRAYTPAEMLSILHQTRLPHVQLYARWCYYRMTIVIEKVS